MGKSLVIEFVGLPGTGKTTNCKCFRAVLNNHHVVVYEFFDVKRYFYEQSFFQKMLIGWKAFFNCKKQLLQFASLLLTHRIWRINSFYRYAKLCLFYQALQEFIKVKPDGIVLLDQWSIQGLWSAIIFKITNVEGLSIKLSRFYFPVDYILYFDVEVETAAQRVATRNTETSRFDKMPEDKRLKTIRKYNDFLLSLFDQANCKQKWTISTTRTPEQNAVDFYKKLKQLNAIQ